MKRTLLATTMLVALVAALPAQASKQRPEIRPFAGALISMGAQRDVFDNAGLFGVETALELNPGFHLVGTLAWAPMNAKYNVPDDAANLIQYDAGVEVGFVRRLAEDWDLKPFIGGGVGGRTYTFAAKALRDRTCLAGYGTVGTEFQVAQLALRVEARDNLFCYQSPLPAGAKATRNDIGLLFGFAYHIR